MALGLITAGTAGAQGIYYYGPGYYGQRYYRPGLPPGQVMQIVRHAGYAPLSGPVRRGPTYVVPAVGRQGQVRVIVDAYEGEIVGVRPMMAAAPYGEPAPYDPRLGNVPPQNVPPGYREPPPGVGPGADPRAAEGNGPVPPRNIPGAPAAPNQRIANAPGAAVVAPPPARTPIPRPRPNVAANEAPAATAAAPARTPTPPAAATPAEVVPEAPPAPARPATPLVPVAPLD